MTCSILISLEPRHAQNILSQAKRVELRRRSLSVDPGTIVWIYSKLPEGSVVGFARIKEIHRASPRKLWDCFKSDVCVTRKEFFEYFGANDQGVAIELTGSVRLKNPVSLEALRQVDAAFQPPQFFKRLRAGEVVTEAFFAAS